MDAIDVTNRHDLSVCLLEVIFEIVICAMTADPNESDRDLVAGSLRSQETAGYETGRNASSENTLEK